MSLSGSRAISKRDVSRSDLTGLMENKSETVKIRIADNGNNSNIDKPGKNEQTELKVMCINLASFSTFLQFIILCGALFFFYLIYGYVQELIFRLKEFKPFGWYLTLMQFAFYTIFGMVERSVGKESERKIPLKMYTLLAFLTVATMGLSNSSLGYLNYPTQVIFKCCKLIPVLVMGIFIQGKTYGLIDVIACLCMSIGLIFFTLADSTVSPEFSVYGVVLISLALCADAVIGNVQEKTMKQYSASNSEMVLYSYGIGFFYILAGQIVTGQLYEAFSFCLTHPIRTYGYGFIFSITGYLGVNIVLTLVKTYGALVAVTVTTCRKAVTIILSFILFTKPFTSQYVWSGYIVLMGIYLSVYSKNKAQWDANIQSYVIKLRTILHKKRKPTPLTVETIV